MPAEEPVLIRGEASSKNAAGVGPPPWKKMISALG